MLSAAGAWNGGGNRWFESSRFNVQGSKSEREGTVITDDCLFIVLTYS